MFKLKPIKEKKNFKKRLSEVRKGGLVCA